MIEIGGVKPTALYVGTNAVSKVYRGQTLVWNIGGLPAGYRKLSYIETTGTQHIDTGIKVGNPVVETAITFSATFSMLQTIAGKEGGFFGGKGTQIASPTLFTATGGTFLSMWCDSGSTNNMTRITLGVPFVISATWLVGSGRLAVINDVTYEADKQNKYINNINAGNYAIFADGSKPVSHSIARLHSDAIIIIDDTEVFHGIPSLDPSGRPCLYDTVTKAPFYNAGTGEFEYE